MFPFYFFSFLIVCALGFWAWYRALTHRSHRVIFVCCGICLILFAVFCIQDAQNVQLRDERLSELQNDPTHYVNDESQDLSVHREKFSNHEVELLDSYKWNSEDPDWCDPQNFQNAVDIFQNVHFVYIEPQTTIEQAESSYYSDLINKPINYLGKIFDIYGWPVQVTKLDNSEISAKFLLDDTQFELMWLECSFENGSAPTYVLLQSVQKNNIETLLENQNRSIGNRAIFIGMTDDNLPVFLAH